MKKDVLKGIGIFLLYIFFSTLLMLLLSTFGIRYSKLSFSNKILFNIISDLILILIIIKIYYKQIKQNFVDYKNHIKEYISQYFKYWIEVIVLMVISNSIISKITNLKTATNQEAVLDTFHKVPLYTIILSVLLAPILEELVFRLSIRKIIKNDHIFIIVSGLLFGLFHLALGSSAKELLFIIPYSIPGFVFAYTLVKSNNIFVPISLHFIHNSVLMLLQILLLFM